MIDSGHVIAEGSPADLASGGGRRSFRMQLPMGALSDLSILTDISAVSDAQWVGDSIEVSGQDAALPEVIGALYSRGIIPEEVHTGARSLDEAFVELITGDREEVRA
ncbi:MAG: hypothetical protein ACK5MR_05915 [Cumulibacter sp.]